MANFSVVCQRPQNEAEYGFWCCPPTTGRVIDQQIFQITVLAALKKARFLNKNIAYISIYVNEKRHYYRPFWQVDLSLLA